MKKLICITLIFVFCLGTCATASVDTNSPCYILMDFKTGKVLAEKNSTQARPIASVTKIMTMLLTMEEIKAGNLTLSEQITASAKASSMGGSQIFLKENEQMDLDTMIKTVFVSSANDSCIAIAERISGSTEEFVKKMNEKAKFLNLKNSQFKNPHGLDEDGHYSCAYDLALISRELMKYDIQKYTKIWQDTIRNGTFTLTNTNKLIRFYPNATGLKTGSTGKAGFCMSATAKRNNLELIAVTLGAETSKERFNDAKALLEYGFSNYKMLSCAKANTAVGKCEVSYGKKEQVLAFPKNDIDFLIKSNEDSKVNIKIELNPKEAPIKNGDILGTMKFIKNGKEIAKVSLVSKENIDKKSYIDIVKDFVKVI